MVVTTRMVFDSDSQLFFFLSSFLTFLLLLLLSYSCLLVERVKLERTFKSILEAALFTHNRRFLPRDARHSEERNEKREEAKNFSRSLERTEAGNGQRLD